MPEVFTEENKLYYKTEQSKGENSSNAKFTDSECLEFFKDRLLTMDDSQLDKDIKASVKELDAKSYYFGNLDGQHIVFSRGWNDIKPGPQNNKTVYRPRSYALQSIWEEASGKVIKYSSYWADPIVIGVY